METMQYQKERYISEKFKTGWTSVKHAEGAGRPSIFTSEEKTVQV